MLSQDGIEDLVTDFLSLLRSGFEQWHAESEREQAQIGGMG